MWPFTRTRTWATIPRLMEVNGWRLFIHPLFHAQLEALTKRVARLASSDPDGYVSHPAAKMLATVNHYIRNAIPRDPNGPEFRQGNTLGPHNRHWFRAKFHGRFRLFYRFSTREKVIVYVWINDEDNLRKSGSKTDPYAVFRAMLESGKPPDSFAALFKGTRASPGRRIGAGRVGSSVVCRRVRRPLRS